MASVESIEATDRVRQPATAVVASGQASPVQAAVSRRSLPLAVLAVIFVASFAVRLVAHDVVITADEDNWMRRAGGFTFGLMNGQLGRTYQTGHPGVTTMWLAMLTLGPQRMVQYADRVTNLRLVGQAPGFWDALVDARPGFALVTALLVTLIAGLAWRLFGGLVGALTGLVVGLEPFLVGISQLVHMDALLSFCMVASVLMSLVRWTRGGGRGWLIGSGALAALAILSKVPAVYMLAFVPALGVGLWLLRSLTPDGRNELRPYRRGKAENILSSSPSPAHGRGGRGVRDILLDLLVWGAATIVMFVVGWPAIWVQGPMSVLSRAIEFTKETGGQPHEQGTFFWGQATADPGPFYYPVSMAFRLAPLTLLGVLLLIVCWRRLQAQDRLPMLTLVGYGIGFLLMMDLGAKKLDRYVLPIFPALGVLAALGMALSYRWISERLAPHSFANIVAPVAASLAILVAVWPAAATYPYFLAYFNPLLGGGRVAQRTIMVGNGEGLDQVATWLNAQPNAQDLWVISHSFDILQPLIVASGESLRDRVPSNADYVVLYRFQIQIAHSPRVLDEYLNRRNPEHVVWINGVEYARIYKGPHQLTAQESPAPSPSPVRGGEETDEASSPPPRTGEGLGVGDSSSLSVLASWAGQVRPRLRRLRSVVAQLIPADADGGP